VKAHVSNKSVVLVWIFLSTACRSVTATRHVILFDGFLLFSFWECMRHSVNQAWFLQCLMITIPCFVSHAKCTYSFAWPLCVGMLLWLRVWYLIVEDITSSSLLTIGAL
jgi:hypothetical protein